MQPNIFYKCSATFHAPTACNPVCYAVLDNPSKNCVYRSLAGLDNAVVMVPWVLMCVSVAHFAVCQQHQTLCKNGQYFKSAMLARSKNPPRFQRVSAQPITVDMSAVPTWWYGSNHKIFSELRAGNGCSVKCDARWHWKTAAMIKLARLMPPRRIPGQIVAVETGEPQVKASFEQFLSADVIISSDLNADVFNLPISQNHVKFFHVHPPTLSAFTTPYYSAIFVSNCQQPRLAWLRRIQSRIPLISFGGCMHTHGASCPRSSCTKVHESSKYPFAIAFENNPMQGGYVSEKLFDAYASNSLPVVWSSLDVVEYTPGPDTFINAANFATPEALADYLTVVRRNVTLYNTFFKWRTNVTRVNTIKKRWLKVGGGKNAICGLCEFVAA